MFHVLGQEEWADNAEIQFAKLQREAKINKAELKKERESNEKLRQELAELEEAAGKADVSEDDEEPARRPLGGASDSDDEEDKEKERKEEEREEKEREKKERKEEEREEKEREH